MLIAAAEYRLAYVIAARTIEYALIFVKAELLLGTETPPKHCLRQEQVVCFTRHVTVAKK